MTSHGTAALTAAKRAANSFVRAPAWPSREANSPAVGDAPSSHRNFAINRVVQ